MKTRTHFPSGRAASAGVFVTSLLSLCLVGGRVAHAQPVSFPDPNLEAVIREAIPKPTGDITEADMLTLTNLFANGKDIHDLTGLETARNLLVLHVEWNPLVGHAPISALTNLVNLSVSATGVTNIAFLDPLLKLEHLNLYSAFVPDVTPLLWRTNLRTLGLGWCGATNAPALATLTGLERLWLGGVALTNVPWIAGLTNLIELGLDYTKLTGMSPVTNLWRLQSLNVGENFLTGYPDLSPLTNLVIFMTAGNQITDLSPLTNLPALRNLHLQRNGLQDVSPLAGCPLLDALLLTGNTGITNLPMLVALTNLQILELGEMGWRSLESVAPLAALPALWQLDLYGSKLTDVSPLTNFPALGWLSLDANHLDQIGPLLDLPALWYLNVKANVLDTNETSAAWNVITNLQARGVMVDYDPQYPPPSPLVFLLQPNPLSTYVGRNIQFAVNVAGGSPEILGYQWQKDGVDLSETGRVNGTDSAELHIDGVEAGDAGFYRVRVWDDWGSTNSRTVQLVVVTNVAFADPNLEEAVRAQLGIYSGPLTPADLQGMTSLYAAYTYWEITNLSGLEAAADLEDLDLNGQFALQGLTPLSFLPYLTTLRLSGCGLDNLNFVADLPALTFLEVSGNFIQDLAPLRQRPGLLSLWLDENQLTDITPLLDLSALNEVFLPFNRLDTNATSTAWNVITNLQDRGVYVEYDPQNPAPVPPVITVQPLSVGAYSGDDVNFHAEATGSGSGLYFRWQKDGANITDTATRYGTDSDTLWIDDVQPGDAGSYRVRVWDENGVTNSRTVQLFVVTNVAFVDPQLEQAVRDALGIPTDPLTLADLAMLTSLDAVGRGITNLSGLEAAVHLESLNLGANPGLGDFTPLWSLPALRELWLFECGLTDAASLAGLTSLDFLDANSNDLRDLSPLTNLTSLDRLFASYNANLTNPGVLTALPGLGELGLAGTGLSNLKFLASLPALYGLDLFNNPIEDVTPLAGLTGLNWLWLGNCQITDASSLASLTGLSSLWLSGNQITNLNFLAGLTNLGSLGLDRNSIPSLAPLAGLTNLWYLDVSSVATADLAPLASLVRLTELKAGNLGLTNLNFLAQLDRLRNLVLDNNPLTGLGFVPSLTNLYSLSLNGTGIRDLSPLAGRTNLLELALAGNGISDVSPLATLPFLRWVGLWDNHVQNISAFSGLTNLTYVEFRHNWLDITPGSPAMTVIATLQARGTTVDYIPQDEAPATITLSAPTWLGGNQFCFTITSAPGAALQIWRSTNFSTWSSAGFVTNTTGATNFTDAAAMTTRSFYRAQQQ